MRPVHEVIVALDVIRQQRAVEYIGEAMVDADLEQIS